MMRIAILEADHWHLSSHIKVITEKKDEVKVVAVSGKGRTAAKTGADLNIPVYSNYNELLDNEKKLDFVYIFGTHRQSTEIIREAVKRGIPFIAEKPCGVDSSELVPILEDIRKKGIVSVVPLWRRYAKIVQMYKEMLQEAAREGQLHMVFRSITGSPERSKTWNCPWALDPYESGGGCLINLGPHYIDLVRYLTMDEVSSVSAVTNDKIWGVGVEDYAALVLKTARGSTATIEVGFTNPGEPYELYNMSGKGFYLTGETGVGITYCKGKGAVETHEFPRGDLYDKNLEDMILSLKGIKKPDITLEDAYRYLRVINDAYKAAESFK